jgi:hypothetical protein
MFIAAVNQRQAGGTAEGNGHGNVQPTLQQAVHPMGQRRKLPTTNDLDRLLLEGRFGVDSQRGQLAFEWSLSTIRCSHLALCCTETLGTGSTTLPCCRGQTYRARFEGTAIAVNLKLVRGGPDYYAVQLDGGKPRVMELVVDQRRLQLFEELGSGPHEVYGLSLGVLRYGSEQEYD